MRYKLYKPINKNYSAIQQILYNRGIPIEQIPAYINASDKDINDYNLLGRENLKNAATALITTIQLEKDAVVVVDCDCDGMGSAAILINYLYRFFPSWVKSHLTWLLHEGKQHGLNDCWKKIIESRVSLVLCPDSSSNDYNEHEELSKKGIQVVILDHHEAPFISEDAITINNQLSDYPNKDFCGGGIVWQFCRYLDEIQNVNTADDFLDLVALTNTSDMMSLKSIETKYLINKGFEPERIHNPFIYHMWQKNKFKLGEHITSWGAAFYIAPFVNAILRSGTQEEKEIVFQSMLEHKAFEQVLSTKRGHSIGETESVVEQAIRICTNVKNRQTKQEEAGLALIEDRIKTNNMMNNKVLLFLIEPGEIPRNIAGLVANKVMGRYQKPCCILTKGELEGKNIYSGSARGCDAVDVREFKDICEGTGLSIYATGHQGAFGLALYESDIQNFIQQTNEILKDMSSEPIHFVDYIFEQNEVDSTKIIDISEMGYLWGKDIPESLIAIKDLKITKDMVTLMSPDKHPTLKIVIPGTNTSLIKFGSSQKEYEQFLSNGFIKADFVGYCAKNEWNGNISAQIKIHDYEIKESCKYMF